MRARIKYVSEGKSHTYDYPTTSIDILPWWRALEKCEIEEFTVLLVE